MEIVFKNTEHAENENFNRAAVTEAFNNSLVNQAYLVDKINRNPESISIEDLVDVQDTEATIKFHARTLGLA